MTSSDLTQSFEVLRQELECLLVDLEDPAINEDYDRICRIEERGQDILNKWVPATFKRIDGRYMFATKFGPASQFGFYFRYFNFQIDPFTTNADAYRWYVTFGKDKDDALLTFASLGFG